MEGEKSKNQEENCEESDEEIEIEDDDDNDEVEDVADDVKKGVLCFVCVVFTWFVSVVISEDEEILKKSEKWERVDCEKKSIVVLHPDTIDAQIRLFQMELNSDCLDVKRDKLDQLSVDKRKSLTPAALKAFEKRLEQQAAVLFEKFASLKKAICDVNREKGKYCKLIFSRV